jgi:hypothetical protein
MSIPKEEKLIKFEDFLSDLSWKNLKGRWQEICNQEKQIQDKKEELKTAILKKADSQEICEEGIFVKKTSRKGNVDYKKIPELSMVDLEQYRKSPIEFWEIKILKD